MNHIQEDVSGGLWRSNSELSRMMSEGRSFSGNERNCSFLNTAAAPAAGGRFANISAVSGLDFPDDGRAVALVDWDQDGDLDMWFSNRNAPRLRLMRNDTPSGNHYLALRLVGNGTSTNRDAIGARVEVVLGESRVKSLESRASESTNSGSRPSTLDPRPLIKTLRAGEGLLAQSSKWLHFGLGAADVVVKVIVHWPGGDTEEFSDIQVDHRYRLVQGSGTGQDMTRPARETILAPSTQKLPPPSQAARIRMVELVTVPKSSYMGFDGRERLLPVETGSLLLVNLWASWCGPCQAELSELSRRHDEIRAREIEIVALSVDGFGDDPADAAAAARLVTASKFPFTVGQATPELVGIFQKLHDRQFPLHRRLPLPTSFLIDRQGRLAVIYKGPLPIDGLLEDVDHAEGTRLERLARSAAIAGQPISHPQVERAANNWAAVLRVRLATDLHQSGLADQAAKEFDHVIKLKPNYAEAHNNLGAALLRLGRLEDAVTHFKDALRIKPDYVEAHKNLGHAMHKLGRNEEAVAHFKDALRIKPDDAEAHTGLGLSLGKLGRFEDAAEHFQQALRVEPDDAATHNNLGFAFENLGRIKEAVTHYQEAVRIEPELAEAHFKLGLVLTGLGRVEEAVPHYQAVLRIEPDRAEVHFKLGNALNRLRRVENAVAHYLEAVRIQPEYVQAHNNLGNSLQGLGRPDEAIAHYLEAVRIQPEYSEAHNNLGMALGSVGRFEEAVAHYQAALRIQPDLAGVHNNLAWLLSTCPDAEIRDGQQAVKHAKKAVRQAGEDNPSVLDTLSAAYAEAGDFQQAVEWQQKSVQLTPDGQKNARRRRLELYKQGQPFREKPQGKSDK